MRHRKWSSAAARRRRLLSPLRLEQLEARDLPSGFTTSAPPYLAPIAAGLTTKALLTTGDVVDRTGAAGQQYRMAGIPDGLGAFLSAPGIVQLFMNHEMIEGVHTSVPRVGGTTYPDTQSGAFVSQFALDAKSGSVQSGDLAFTTIVIGTDPTPIVPGVTPLPSGTGTYGPFSRFCSGFLGGPNVGLDRYIYFAGEENGAAKTFDRQGGEAVAIFDGVAHVLPGLGHFEHENVVVLPGTGNKTVILSMEDAGTLTSQLYMYVGTKDPTA